MKHIFADDLKLFCHIYIYCILRGRIKGFNSAIYAIKCQQVVIALDRVVIEW